MLLCAKFPKVLSKEETMRNLLAGISFFAVYIAVGIGSMYYHSVIEYGYEKMKHAVVGDGEFIAIWPLPSVGDTLHVWSPLAGAEVADLDNEFGKECDVNGAVLEIERFSDGLIIAKVISRERELSWYCPVGTSVMMTRSDWMELVDDTNDRHEKARAKTERLKRTRDLLEHAK